MNLTARMPSVVSSSASSNPGRTTNGYQEPGKPVASDDRTGQPVETVKIRLFTKRIMVYPGLLKKWKSGAAEHDRSGKPARQLLGI